MFVVFFFSSRRRHTRYWRDWSSDVCSSDLLLLIGLHTAAVLLHQPDPLLKSLELRGPFTLLRLAYSRRRRGPSGTNGRGVRRSIPRQAKATPTQQQRAQKCAGQHAQYRAQPVMLFLAMLFQSFITFFMIKLQEILFDAF